MRKKVSTSAIALAGGLSCGRQSCLQAPFQAAVPICGEFLGLRCTMPATRRESALLRTSTRLRKAAPTWERNDPCKNVSSVKNLGRRCRHERGAIPAGTSLAPVTTPRGSKQVNFGKYLKINILPCGFRHVVTGAPESALWAVTSEAMASLARTASADRRSEGPPAGKIACHTMTKRSR
jgi:hypothetical protein